MEEQATFWSFTNTGEIQPEIIDIYEFLNDKGYRIKKEKEVLTLFKIDGNIIEEVYEDNLIYEVINYLSNDYDDYITATIKKGKGYVEVVLTAKQVLEKITKFKFSRIFNKENWRYFKPLNEKIKKHTKNSAFFYFKNCFIEVTANGIFAHDYKDLDGVIFRSLIIDKDISIIDIYGQEEKELCKNGYCFFDFLQQICNYEEVLKPGSGEVKAQDYTNRLNYLMSLVGYLIHDFRKKGTTDFGVIFCDDEVGGSGKGLITQALSQITDICSIDSKRAESDFDSGNLSISTKIKVYNDIKRGFDFEKVYNEITDGGTIVYKYGNEQAISYEDTWKVLILANFPVTGSKSSDIRRQAVYNLIPYFNAKNTVFDKYKHSFFSEDWEPKDWNYFFNVMFKCVELWLCCDYTKPEYKDQDYLERKKEADYPGEFRKFIDKVASNNFFSLIKTWYEPIKLYSDFQDENSRSEWARKISSRSFSIKVRFYCEEMDYVYDKNHNRTEILISRKK